MPVRAVDIHDDVVPNDELIATRCVVPRRYDCDAVVGRGLDVVPVDEIGRLHYNSLAVAVRSQVRVGIDVVNDPEVRVSVFDIRTVALTTLPGTVSQDVTLNQDVIPSIRAGAAAGRVTGGPADINAL